MKRILLTAAALLFAGLVLQAQIKDEETTSATSATWMEKHYFQTLGLTLLVDYYIPPAVEHYFIQETNAGTDTFVYHVRGWGFNLISVTYDARVNLYDFNDRMSVSVNVPASFGFGPSEPGGLLSFASPVLADFNYGCHSTYNNIDRMGFHAGIGFDVMITPLVVTERWRELHRFWAAPMLRVGVKGPYKNHNSFVSFQATLPQKYYDESEHQSLYHRVHFKCVVGWLLNYD